MYSEYQNGGEDESPSFGNIHAEGSTASQRDGIQEETQSREGDGLNLPPDFLYDAERLQSGSTPSASSNIKALSPMATLAFNNPPSIIGLPLTANIQHLTSRDERFSNQTFQATQHSGGLGSLVDPPRTTRSLMMDTPFQQLPYSPQTPGENRAEMNSTTTTPLDRPMTTKQSTITHPREAYLVKFFTQTWGPIFDCLDADYTFTREVTRTALTSSQALLWAVLATSALQLSRVSNYPFAAAQYYRSQCSKCIMPILLTSAHPEVREDTLFATYVILRNYEHMTGTKRPLSKHHFVSDEHK